MFWGLSIEPGKHYTQTVDESFHVSMAALETRDVASPERDKVKMTQLIVQHDKAEFLVCTLCFTGNIFQQYLDLNFTEGEEVTFFTEGRGTVHLTGYLVRDDPLTIDPDMVSLDEISSSDGVASNSEGWASGEESSVESQVKVERSNQLPKSWRKRRLQGSTRSAERQRSHHPTKKRKTQHGIHFGEGNLMRRKGTLLSNRNILVSNDDMGSLRRGTNCRRVPPLSLRRGLRLQDQHGQTMTDDLKPTWTKASNHSETLSSVPQSTLTPVYPQNEPLGPPHSQGDVTIQITRGASQHTVPSSADSHMESCDIEIDNSSSPDEDVHSISRTFQTESLSVVKTSPLKSSPSSSQPVNVHSSAEGRDVTSLSGIPDKRPAYDQPTEPQDLHVPLSKSTIPAERTKQSAPSHARNAYCQASRLNNLRRILPKPTRKFVGSDVYPYRKTTLGKGGCLNSVIGQIRHSSNMRWSVAQSTTTSPVVGKGFSQPVISKVVGGREATEHFETAQQQGFDYGENEQVSRRILHTEDENQQEMSQTKQEQPNRSAIKIFQSPCTLRAEDPCCSTNHQQHSTYYSHSLVPTSLILAGPGQSTPSPVAENATQAVTMPEMDSVYWSCMSDEPVMVTGDHTDERSHDGIPVASDLSSLTSYDMTCNGVDISDQKVRLAHGYDVFITRRDLLQAERASKQSWSIFVRRLLDVLFDHVTLAMGRASNFGASQSDRKPLDQNVVGAIRAFFKARFNINKRELMQAIGYYCHDLRYKMMQELQNPL